MDTGCVICIKDLRYFVISCCVEKFFTRGDWHTVLYVRNATGINFQEMWVILCSVLSHNAEVHEFICHLKQTTACNRNIVMLHISILFFRIWPVLSLFLNKGHIRWGIKSCTMLLEYENRLQNLDVGTYIFEFNKIIENVKPTTWYVWGNKILLTSKAQSDHVAGWILSHGDEF